MLFEFERGHSLRKDLRRIVRNQLNDALAELAAEHKEPRDEVVHEVRKRFKKLRAVLRLVRPAIADRCYRAENICFRDAARPLTEVRDARILIETLDKLVEHSREQIAGRVFAELRKSLQEHLRAVRRQVLDKQNAFVVTGAVVRQAAERIKRWIAVPNQWSTLAEGLENTYRQARTAYTDAADDPTVTSLHEWRKQVKYVRHQLELLRPIWPERLEELAREAAHLGDLLGDGHDLAVLRQMVTADAATADHEALVALIDRRRAELRQQELPLGARYFQDRPRTFARRLKGYWRSWRAQPAAAMETASAAAS
jgi:CHAD domain-containing protein